MPTPKIIKLFVYIIVKAYLKAMQSHTCLASQSLRAVTIFHSFSSSSAGHTPQFILMCQRQCSSYSKTVRLFLLRELPVKRKIVIH